VSREEFLDSTVASAFKELRSAQVMPPDPMPFVHASMSRRRRARRVALGGACLIAASSAAVVAGHLWAGGDTTPIAADSTRAEVTAETALDLSSPGLETAQVRDVSVRCRSVESQGSDVELLTIQSVDQAAPLLRLQTSETELVEGTALNLPLDDTGGSAAQAPALFEIFAALRDQQGNGVEATSTSQASQGTIKVIASSCTVGDSVAMDVDVWLGPESGDQAIHVVGRLAGTVVD